MKILLISLVVIGWVGVFAAGTFFAVKAVKGITSAEPEVMSVQTTRVEATPTTTQKRVSPTHRFPKNTPTPVVTTVNCQIGDSWYNLSSSEECTAEQNKYAQVMRKYYESVKQGYAQQPQLVAPTIKPYTVGVYPTSKPLPSLPTAKPIDGTITIIGNTPAPTVPVGYGAN